MRLALRAPGPDGFCPSGVGAISRSRARNDYRGGTTCRRRLLLLAAAGAAGTLCRYGLAGLVQSGLGTRLPWSTLVVTCRVPRGRLPSSACSRAVGPSAGRRVHRAHKASWACSRRSPAIMLETDGAGARRAVDPPPPATCSCSMASVRRPCTSGSSSPGSRSEEGTDASLRRTPSCCASSSATATGTITSRCTRRSSRPRASITSPGPPSCAATSASAPTAASTPPRSCASPRTCLSWSRSSTRRQDRGLPAGADATMAEGMVTVQERRRPFTGTTTAPAKAQSSPLAGTFPGARQIAKLTR